MQRSPLSVIALILACLLLVGCAALEQAPRQQSDNAPSPHTVHAPTRNR
jgi:PBP1b-binding outer membrane lipoprotein LpoB